MFFLKMLNVSLEHSFNNSSHCIVKEPNNSYNAFHKKLMMSEEILQ